MKLRLMIGILIFVCAQPVWAFFPFLRCDGIGDFNDSPSYCRVCFAANINSNSRLCSGAYFNQSPDVQLLTQNLEDDFDNNFNKLKRLPEEGFEVFRRNKNSNNACVDSQNQLEFIDRQIEYLKSKKAQILGAMNAQNCMPENQGAPKKVERLPASNK